MRSKAYIQNKTEVAMRCTQKTIKPAVRLRCVQINRKSLCRKIKEQTYPFCLAIDSKRSVMAGREDTRRREEKTRLSEMTRHFPRNKTSALKRISTSCSLPCLLTPSHVQLYTLPALKIQAEQFAWRKTNVLRTAKRKWIFFRKWNSGMGSYKKTNKGDPDWYQLAPR